MSNRPGNTFERSENFTTISYPRLDYHRDARPGGDDAKGVHVEEVGHRPGINFTKHFNGKLCPKSLIVYLKSFTKRSSFLEKSRLQLVVEIQIELARRNLLERGESFQTKYNQVFIDMVQKS